MLRILVRGIALILLLGLVVSVAAAQDEQYEDPQGRYSAPIPTNWVVEETEDYAVLLSPEGTIKLYLLVLPSAGSADETIAEAWSLVNPDFAGEVDSTLEPPSQPPVESTLVINYEFDNTGPFYQAVAQTVGEEVYLILVEGELTDIQRRAAQIGIISSGYTITGTSQTDLTGAEMRPIDAEMIAALESYVNELMPQFKVPGAVIAIVQDGQIVYTGAFGVRQQGGDEPMTVETHMMIGSSGKSLTTTMMASLVDDGLMTWETPVIEIVPDFQIADPQLTQQITVKNLVCACTGVPRRDLEFALRADELTAEAVVESLATFELFTDFGEAFQYSNQMVATGGYVAAAAGGGEWGSLFDSYAALLRDRVLDPVGMPQTTIYFSDVLARGDYAIPHALGFDYSYSPLALDAEMVLVPIAPAGAHWSTVTDMANYVIMQLNNGVAADGTCVVSEASLLVTREPQIAVSANSSYGLGWFVGQYKGLPLIEHGGNTLGFTSDVAFLPDAGLGMVVLTNAQASNSFNSAVRSRLFDLVFDDVDAETDAEALAFTLEQMAELTKAPETLQDSVDVAVVQAYTGTFANTALGEAVIELVDGELFLDAGSYRSELLPVLDEDDPETVDFYMTLTPPLAGLQLRFVETETGEVSIVFGSGVNEYTFTPVE